LNNKTFDSLGLISPFLDNLVREGYTQPTPIQTSAIPPVLEGRDILGIAQTGTGKTAAFALPLLQRLKEQKQRPEPKTCHVLVVAPTRELAAQISESFTVYGRDSGVRQAVVFGGVGINPQIAALSRGVDVLIATPGRLIDLINQGHLTLSRVASVVLDEADRMLDMGFLPDIKRIIAKLPAQRQTLLFSATMPKEITAFAESILRNPVRVSIAPNKPTAERIEQKLYFVAKDDKRKLLTSILKDTNPFRTIIFTRTKHGANRLVKMLDADGIGAEAIHANKSQNARTRAMAAFKKGDIGVLVATDLASRGIDVDGIDLVVNFDLPNEPETYVHRIGRTARAGAEGKAVSFCDHEEKKLLKDIERFTGLAIPVELKHPFPLKAGGSAQTPETREPRPFNNFRGRGQNPSGNRKPAESRQRDVDGNRAPVQNGQRASARDVDGNRAQPRSDRKPQTGRPVNGNRAPVDGNRSRDLVNEATGGRPFGRFNSGRRSAETSGRRPIMGR
jgi:ATP-dependent RNA helicase RhlE